jgi:hypothetical protein
MDDWDSSDTETDTEDSDTDNEMDTEQMVQELKEKYTDVTSPLGYTDAKTIYTYFKGGLHMDQIMEFLSSKDAYTLTKRTRRARYYNMTYCKSLRENIQMDVFFMQEFQKDNDGITHILLGVDVWSRFMWSCPIRNTSANEGLRGTKEILTLAGGYTKNLTVDKGSEFISNKYKTYIKGQKIKLHYTNSKASIVERAILTLKRYIYRYMAETDKLKYIDKLDHFVNIYNDHFHRFLQMSPREAEMKENQKRVKRAHDRKKAEMRSRRQKPRFKPGDKIRLSRIKNRMERGFDNTHNYEIFEIDSIDTNLPIPRYYVKQPETNEKIQGCFYANEIVLVRQHKYKLTVLKERVRRGKKEYFVKWKGYPGRFKCNIIFCNSI